MRKVGKRSLAGVAVLAFVVACVVFLIVRELDPEGD